jgi:hypothetical protein
MLVALYPTCELKELLVVGQSDEEAQCYRRESTVLAMTETAA